MEILKFCLLLSVLIGLINSGNSLRCYECAASLGQGDNSPCLTGEEFRLRRVRCIGPSVCAFYRYESSVPGTPPITHVTRGCQSLRFGGTCEDIFNDLRRRGQVLPGQHTCATCSSDLCNSTNSFKRSFSVLLITSMVSVLYVYILS